MIVPMLSESVSVKGLDKVNECPPDGRHCEAWLSQATSALETLSPDGWCVIGGEEDARADHDLARSPAALTFRSPRDTFPWR